MLLPFVIEFAADSKRIQPVTARRTQSADKLLWLLEIRKHLSGRYRYALESSMVYSGWTHIFCCRSNSHELPRNLLDQLVGIKIYTILSHCISDGILPSVTVQNTKIKIIA